MRYGQPAMGSLNWGPYGSQAFGQAGGAVQSYGQGWPGGYGGMGGFPGAGAHAQQGYNPEQTYGGAAQYDRPLQPAYPPSFYPGAPDQRQQQPSTLPQRPIMASSAFQYYPESRLQTTADGYTLSSAYAGTATSSGPSFDAVGPPTLTERDPVSRKGRKGAPGQSSGSGPQIVKCCKDDCSFTGSKKQVREHEEDRHLIYAPGREPKPWSGSLKPVDGAVIEGTGLALDTPEAVAKWIEERKKRWPSKKVVEEKDEEDRAEELAAKRVKLEMGGGAADVKRSLDAAGPLPPMLTDESDLSDSDEDDGPPEESTTMVEVMDAQMDDDLTTAGDHAGAREAEEEAVDALAEDAAAEASKKRFQVVCRHWRKGNCALGDDACPYLHEIPANAPPPPLPRRKRPAPPPPPHNPFARPAGYSDPFSLLEERDYQHLVSDVLQVIEFLGANDWLKSVEIRPGQLDEESGIEVLEDRKVEDQGATQEAHVDPKIESEVEDDSDEDLVITPVVKHAALIDETPSALMQTVDSIPSAQPAAVPPLTAPRLPTKAAASSALASLVADYGSDTDDEGEEESVAAALMGRA
ncbi:zinc finger, CCCH-type protein [Rhodotorula toruloides]|uniref:Zinc finger, CCCH-type protein n=1 Tax=Rhodotorula toruloides TaxID=5286 RepID=A0A511K6Y8_RHOTO|nr:zinc finger, CCCH-type protein [Rhodotorula toruloides]